MGIFFCIFDYQFRSEGKCQSLTQHIALKTLVWFRPTADDIGNNGSGSDGFITSTGGQRYVPTLLCTTLFPSSSSSPPARHSALSFTSYFILTHFPCDFHPFPSSVLTLRSSSSPSHPYTVPIVPILSKNPTFSLCSFFLQHLPPLPEPQLLYPFPHPIFSSSGPKVPLPLAFVIPSSPFLSLSSFHLDLLPITFTLSHTPSPLPFIFSPIRQFCWWCGHVLYIIVMRII